LIVATLVIALAAGYWWGSARHPAPEASIALPAAGPAAAPARRILYYKHPMGLKDTSPVPKKDAMGMDYLPVYEGEEPQGPLVKISLDKVQKLGVRTEPAARRALSRTIRATGIIEVDERRVHTVSPKFEGWIQRLYVNATGQRVERGAPLMDVYSPDLLTTQQEYVIGAKGLAAVAEADTEARARMQSLLDSSLVRLRNWDIAPSDIERLKRGEAANNTIVLRSPAGGVVLDKPALQGMRFMPGEMLFKIADLSNLWLVANVFEQDLGLVHVGQTATLSLDAYPNDLIKGRVAFIYPTVDTETRTARVRIELSNSRGQLRPAMYARVALDATHSASPKLAIPVTAILDSGTRRVVFVERGEGIFEPREVTLGFRGDGYVEVLQGVLADERVVVTANFLIDAESNLKAALDTFGHGHGGAPSSESTRGGESAVPNAMPGMDMSPPPKR
jgi:Cu(I)/Ag(I) efflux system membrane fusion protein